MRPQAQFLSTCASFLFGAVLALSAQPAVAALSLSNTPLFLTVSVPPNIVLTLDDSGSMRRAFVPENCLSDTSDCALLDNRYEKSAHRNLIHYNPAITYPQPRAADGTILTTSYTAAYRNGFDRSPSSTSATVNLSTSYKPSATLDLASGAVSEDWMGHYSGDVRCNPSGSGTRYCQRRTGASSWTNTPPSTPLACSHITHSDATTQQQRRDNFCRGTQDTFTGTTENVPVGVPAYYYVFNGSNSGCTGTAAEKAIDNDCYTLTWVAPAEQQNFANWYSFARTRNLATQTAASIAFFDLDQTARVGWQALNSCNNGASGLVDTDCDGWKNNFSSVSNAIRPYTGTHRTNFLNWVQQQPTANGTPLPTATQRVGAYYSTGGENSPYDNDFSTSNSGEHACRRNYHILMTDGIWTTSQGGTPQDTATYNLPQAVDGVTQYAPMAPYNSASTDTLADVAFRYSITDLRPTLSNGVTPLIKDTTGTLAEQFWNPKNDPYPWQHMVNFTIGLGLSGYLTESGLAWAGNTFTGSYPSIAAGTTSWPAAFGSATNAGNVADLWHAAINSRGQFFSADDPASLATSFGAVIGAITGDSGSSAALSANSTSIQPGNTYVYQAKFNKDWSGTLLAFQVNDTTGAITGTNNWDASALIPAHASRRIFTHNGTNGVEFRLCTSLGITQQAALALNSSGVPDLYCQNRLDWLRGSSADEQRSTSVGSLRMFRNRPTNVMGDIVNSDPAYVKAVDYGYGNLPDGTAGKTTYASYLATTGDPMTGRQPMVYVGSNDGRLYGIKATANPEPNSGAEIFSYVPSGVYTHLARLTDPNYTHRFYVDGGVTAGDAYLTLGATTAWRTIVVGGLNGGGRSIYALNVTDPAAAASALPATAATTVVMWEYTEPTDTDLGFTYSQPQIGLMQNGTDWVAVFGNGYNSSEGGAYLYIVNLATGALIRKIPVGTNVLGVDDNNGLSTPFLYDSDGDKKIDTIYAGDLQGHMWKFNVTGASGSWGVAYPGTPNGAPLFTARNASGQVQPITAQPKAAGHPLGGHMVTFGTGRYLALGDVTDTTVQTFYGIRDYGSSPVSTTDRSELQQQTISLQVNNQFNRDIRAISNEVPNWNVERGWYLDLLDPVAPPNNALGERVVSTSILLEGRVIFVTIVPSQDPCLPGGYSWLMELDLVNGGTFPESILDLNNDNLFNTEDEVQGEVVSGVRNVSLGLSKTPVVIGAGAGNMAFKELTGTRGAFATEKNKLGSPPPPPAGSVSRRSWIQIR
jgi:type IV pilus assembly protein PilY1